MKIKQLKIEFVFLVFLFACGTNTSTPVFPIYTFYPVNSPAIVDVKPVEIQQNNQIRIEFDIYYYVTNTEDEFVGYNLYISTSTISPDLIQAGIGISPYLPQGYEPTFFHTKDEVSVESSKIQKKRVPNLKPHPSEIPFQICERYYFRLRAVLRTGILSSPGPEISACAKSSFLPCPKETACYEP
ncbi:MAG: hypothetical protein NZ853_03975 [Leptospiraceae bacterium]|nr:hypothetical protein [Leptospiraceae bacterium]MDW7975333.1 hypothetical protein [Leptospiraceae bacterium]